MYFIYVRVRCIHVRVPCTCQCTVYMSMYCIDLRVHCMLCHTAVYVSEIMYCICHCSVYMTCCTVYMSVYCVYVSVLCIRQSIVYMSVYCVYVSVLCIRQCIVYTHALYRCQSELYVRRFCRGLFVQHSEFNSGCFLITIMKFVKRLPCGSKR